MLRKSFSLMDHFYQEGRVYEALPTYRRAVTAGQTVNLSAEITMQSGKFTNNAMTGGLFAHYFFFVPNRITWDGWMPFIAQDDDYATALPTTSTNWGEMFDRGDGPYSALPRRAYKEIYNRYFGDQDINSAQTWYSDAEKVDDTHITMRRIRNSEQWVAGGKMGIAADPTYSVSSPIPLNDFYRQLMNARQLMNSNLSGDRYVDAMKRKGVSLSWMVQDAPELLGRKQVSVKPKKVFQTDTTSGGKFVARYETSLVHNCPNKRFAEDGIIIGISVFKPHLFNSQWLKPLDGEMTAIEDFFLGENGQTYEEIDRSKFSTAASGTTHYFDRFPWLTRGQNCYGVAAEWANTFTPAQADAAIYVDPGDFTISSELASGRDFAVSCDVRLDGKIPAGAKLPIGQATG